jgi:adenylate cyclase class 2
MIEVEVKAIVPDKVELQQALEQLAPSKVQTLTYRDTYFDTGERAIAAKRRQVRLRTIAGGSRSRHILTAKREPIDAFESMPEFETEVSDRDEMGAILRTIGLHEDIAFEKKCINYHLSYQGRSILATIVDVDCLPETFLELEALVGSPGEIDAARTILAHLCSTLKVSEEHLTNELYMTAVRRARAQD